MTLLLVFDEGVSKDELLQKLHEKFNKSSSKKPSSKVRSRSKLARKKLSPQSDHHSDDSELHGDKIPSLIKTDVSLTIKSDIASSSKRKLVGFHDGRSQSKKKNQKEMKMKYRSESATKLDLNLDTDESMSTSTPVTSNELDTSLNASSSRNSRMRTISTGSENECKVYLKEKLKHQKRTSNFFSDEPTLPCSICDKDSNSGKYESQVRLNDRKRRYCNLDKDFKSQPSPCYQSGLLPTKLGKNSTTKCTFKQTSEQTSSTQPSQRWKNCHNSEQQSRNSAKKKTCSAEQASLNSSGENRDLAEVLGNIGSSQQDLNGLFPLSDETSFFEKKEDPPNQGPLRIPDELYVALDCEMVGVGPKGSRSKLARCSIVDYSGNVIYDKYIKPEEQITDYRTPWSGIMPSHMKMATPTLQALEEIKACLENKIMIGHAVYHDFKVLGIQPQAHTVRDTHSCKKLVEMAGLEGQGNGLKKLALALLGRNIQASKRGHCSVEDARAALDLFKLVREEWEPQLFAKWQKKSPDLDQKYTEMMGRGSEQHEDFLHDRFWQ